MKTIHRLKHVEYVVYMISFDSLVAKSLWLRILSFGLRVLMSHQGDLRPLRGNTDF